MRWFRVILCALPALHVSVHGTVAQEIRISHQWAEYADVRDRAARIFVQEAQIRSQGLKFRVYANSSLNIKPSNLLEALQNDKLEMAVYPLVYAVPKVPEFSLAGLPGLVPNAVAAQALKNSDVYAMLQSIAEENGFRILALLWNPGGFLSKTREITAPQSVEGLTMRVADPLFGLMFKRAGAVVTSMPSNEIYASLGVGPLDAVVTTYESILSLRLYERVKYATLGGPVLFMGFSPLVMSLSTWKKLTPEQKVAIEEAAGVADSYYDSAQRDVEQRTIVALRAAGVAIHTMSKDDYLSWLQLAQQTAWLEYTKINPRSRHLLFTLVSTILNSINEGG